MSGTSSKMNGPRTAPSITTLAAVAASPASSHARDAPRAFTEPMRGEPAPRTLEWVSRASRGAGVDIDRRALRQGTRRASAHRSGAGASGAADLLQGGLHV